MTASQAVKFYTRDTARCTRCHTARDTAKCARCHTCEWSFTHVTQQNVHNVTLVSDVLHMWHSKICTTSHLWVKCYTRDTAKCARCHTSEWSFTHVTAKCARCHTCECEVLHTWHSKMCTMSHLGVAMSVTYASLHWTASIKNPLRYRELYITVIF